MEAEEVQLLDVSEEATLGLSAQVADDSHFPFPWNTTLTVLTSVGGFSKPERRQIKSLQDLVATIQRLELSTFDTAELQNEQFIGEGGSYRVSRREHPGSGRVYAVKEIKLPHGHADLASFEWQVGCVLRDIETMACLSENEHILNIFGYGWNIQRGSIIPVVITEYAAGGTLRNYLRTRQVPLHEKLRFCQDVAQGLHALHECGVAHGDLKLENILASTSSSNVIACLSDFGHSIHLSDNNEDGDDHQRYGGTPAYNAPEIRSSRLRNHEDLDYRKCDIWSLGLLCWEILVDGEPYYQKSRVANAGLPPSVVSDLVDHGPAASLSDCNLTDRFLQRLGAVKLQLCDIARDDLSRNFGSLLTPAQLVILLSLFEQCLAVDVLQRAANVQSLPFLRIAIIKSVSGQSAKLLTSGRTRPSYETFWKSNPLPHRFKCQLLAECERVAGDSNGPFIASRAALHASLSYMNGFGCQMDIHQAIHWLNISISKGFRDAEIFLPAFEDSLVPSDPNMESDESFKSFIIHRECRKIVLKGLGLGHLHPSKHQWYEDRISQLRKPGASLSPTIDAQDRNGNTLLQLACRAGELETVEWLLEKGADPTIANSHGCVPLHWLFMLPPASIASIANLLSRRVTTNINAFAFVEQVIDAQIPLRLVGTPLAYSVAMESNEAVLALLKLGADPLVGSARSMMYSKGPLVTRFHLSALHVACWNHLSKFVSYFVENIPLVDLSYRHSVPSLHPQDVADFCWYTFPSASQAELVLRHGKATSSAARATAEVLIRFGQWYGYRPDPMSLFLPPVQQGNLKAAYVVLDAVRSFDVYGHGPPIRGYPWFVRATDTVCSGSFSTQTSVAFLDFGVELMDALKPWAGEAIVGFSAHIPIARHNAEILDWFHARLVQMGDGSRSHLGYLLGEMIKSGFSSDYDMRKFIEHAPPEALQHAAYTAIEFHAALDLEQILQCGKLEVGVCKLLDAATDLRTNPHIINTLLAHGKAQGVPQGSLSTKINELMVGAIRSGSLSLMRVLIDQGADLMGEISPGRRAGIPGPTCLFHAVSSGRKSVLGLLLESGAKPDPQVESAGFPLLYQALFKLDDYHPSANRAAVFACAQLILEVGAEFKRHVNGGGTLLEVVLRQRREQSHYDFAEVLICRGANPNVTDISGESLLEYAIREQDLKLLGFLLQHGASVDNPLLGLAVFHASLKTRMSVRSDQRIRELTVLCAFIESLLEAGADPRAVVIHDPVKRHLEVAAEENNGPGCLALLRMHQKLASIKTVSLESPPSSPWHGMRRLLRGRYFKQKGPSKCSTDGLFDVQSTNRAWRKAVERESWDSVAAFFEAGLAGSTKLFSVPSGLKLLQYAIQNENEAILVAFMGDRLHTPGESPDAHLGKVWKQIQTCFHRFETIERYGQGTLVNKDFHFEEFLIANKCRLQNLCTVGGYHRKLGWQEMVEKGYIETQSESGLFQVVEAGFGQDSESEMLSGIFLNPEVEEQIERLGGFCEWPRSTPQSTIPVRFPTEVIPTIYFKEFPHSSVQAATSSPATWNVAETIVSRLFKLEDACLMAPSIHEYVEFRLDPGFLEVVSVDFGNHGSCSQFQSGQVQVSLLAFEAAVRPATFDQALCDQAIGVALAGGFSVAQLPVGYQDSLSGQLFYVDPHSYRYPFRRQYRQLKHLPSLTPT